MTLGLLQGGGAPPVVRTALCLPRRLQRKCTGHTLCTSMPPVPMPLPFAEASLPHLLGPHPPRNECMYRMYWLYRRCATSSTTTPCSWRSTLARTTTTTKRWVHGARAGCRVLLLRMLGAQHQHWALQSSKEGPSSSGMHCCSATCVTSHSQVVLVSTTESPPWCANCHPHTAACGYARHDQQLLPTSSTPSLPCTPTHIPLSISYSSHTAAGGNARHDQRAHARGAGAQGGQGHGEGDGQAAAAVSPWLCGVLVCGCGPTW